MVSAHICERASVFSSCRYMCTTSVSTYLLSSVCFKWHKCIEKRHTYPEERTSTEPNTNTVLFLDTKVGRFKYSDFELTQRKEFDTERHTT